jgi:hypothetical protein
MYVWPSHFPTQCPPTEATELVGIVYRFINKQELTDWDFLSHYERAPHANWSHSPCNCRGLSVVRTSQDYAAMRDAVPALRKKKIAIADINSSVGVISTTPSNSCNDHCTWWRSPTAAEVRAMFNVLDERKGGTK